MTDKDREKHWVSARALSDGEGPTFPKLTRTSPFHMLTHDGPVPDAKALEGKYHRIDVKGEPASKGAQHNPSVWVSSDGTTLHAIVRVLHGSKTTNYVAEVLSDFTLGESKLLQTREPAGSLEDLRPFMWNGALWAIAATHNGAAPPVAIRQALLELSEDGSEVLRVHTQPSIRHEKNWMPCVSESSLRLVYSTEPLVVLNVENRRATPNAAMVPQSTGHMRGGTQLVPWDGGFLAVVHQVHRPALVAASHNPLLSGFWAPAIQDPVSGAAPVVYLHRFAKFDAALSSVSYSAPFYFQKLGVEFCAGLAHFNGSLVAAFGVADREAWLVEVTGETVDRMFLRAL